MRLRWDSVTASRGNPCRPLGSRPLSLAVRLPEATSRTLEQKQLPCGFCTDESPNANVRVPDQYNRSVSRGGTRPLVALLLALLAALLLAACGGGSSGSGSSGTTGGSEATSAEPGNGEATGSLPGSGGAGEGDAQSTKSGGARKKPDVATPLKVSGGGSQQFVVKGGDNSIQEFGEEAGEAELREAAEAVHGFFVARAEGRWADACSHLSSSMLEQLEGLAEKSERASCASFLASFTTQLPPSTWREITTVDAGSLRQEGDRAFLIYYGAPEKAVYSMPLAQEGGEWKVGALSGDALQG